MEGERLRKWTLSNHRTIILVKKRSIVYDFHYFDEHDVSRKFLRLQIICIQQGLLTGATILKNIKILGTYKLVSPLLNAIKMIKFARFF